MTVGQGRRTKVKVKCQNPVLTSLLSCFKVRVKGREPGQSNVCRVQQRPIIVITSLRCLCTYDHGVYTDNCTDAVNGNAKENEQTDRMPGSPPPAQVYGHPLDS